MSKFRWVDPDESKKDPFGGEAEGKSEFEALLETDQGHVSARRYRMGETITGHVMSVGQEFVFVDLGGKNTGTIGLEEFRTDGSVMPKAGDEVSLYVRQDTGSEVLLTRSLRRSETDDIMLREAFHQQLPVEGKVDKVNKGGFEVSLGSFRAFVPMSNMEVGPVSNPESYIGMVLKFMILKFEGTRNIVLSRKSLLREEAEEKAKILLNTLEVGQRVRGTVTRLAAFGAFVDIGGVEGLVPMSELSWTRIKKPEEACTPGDSVMVKILKIEHSPKRRIALSLKDAGDDPWSLYASRLEPGAILDGKVTRLVDFGAFVSVFDGVEGLVHVSQLTWEKRVGHPKEIVKDGQMVSVHVLDVNAESRKLSLSLKGPMPAEMVAKLESRKKSHGELTGDEIELDRELQQYRKFQAQSEKRASESSLAVAFQQAQRKNRK